MTKVFTATLLGILERRGRLRLEDPVAAHLSAAPAVLPDEPPITLLQLASHTSGLPREPVNRRDLEGSPSVMLPFSTAELEDGLRATTRARAPGGAFLYSNLGYAVLGRALEHAAGAPFEELLRRELLLPLGLGDTSIALDEARRARLATAYWDQDDPLVPREPWRFGEVAAFGGLTSSLSDLARFASFVLRAEDELLDSGTRARLLQPRHAVDERGRAVACGWFQDEIPGAGRVLGTGGEVDGYNACFILFPEKAAGVVILSNVGGRSAEELFQRLLPVLLPALSAR